MFMYFHIYIYMDIYTYTYIHTHIYIYVFSYTHIRCHTLCASSTNCVFPSVLSFPLALATHVSACCIKRCSCSCGSGNTLSCSSRRTSCRECSDVCSATLTCSSFFLLSASVLCASNCARSCASSSCTRVDVSSARARAARSFCKFF